MAQRLRLYDLRTSRLPSAVGACASDIARLAQILNSAQARLVLAKESGDEGWYGSWAEVAWNVSRTAPYITLPREIARIEAVTVCSRPVPVSNPFIQYLQFGSGRLPKLRSQLCPGRPTSVIARNNAVTFADMTNAPQFVVAYASDPSDIQTPKRVLIQGLDQNGAEVYSMDGLTTPKLPKISDLRMIE